MARTTTDDPMTVTEVMILNLFPISPGRQLPLRSKVKASRSSCGTGSLDDGKVKND
jgi:hypothetical protein